MTQPPPIPAPVPAIRPVRLETTAPVVPLASPKLSPSAAPAPAPVYRWPRKQAVRKNEPILTAKSVPPTQWTPAPYQAPPQPSVQTTRPAPVEQPAATEVPVALPASRPVPALRKVTLQVGMPLPIRVDELLSTERSAAGDTFQASLAEPLVVTGLVIAEKGARVTGRVVDSKRAGRAGGQAVLILEISNISTSDGQRIAISTDPWTKRGETPYGEDAGRTGAGIPSETIIRFRLATRVTIAERQIAGR